jgi:capsular polysaccharide transport system permease protein
MKLKSVTTLFQNKLLLITTIIPTALAILYFGLIASDVYISESRFVVRSPERQTASPLGLILKGAGFSKAQDDSYTVQDYVLSRDALKALDDELKIKEAYSSSSIDLFSRFAGTDWDDSLEAFHQYYQKKVNVQLDSASSITTLTVRAYTSEAAQGVNQRLVELAESLVNKLNERGRQDMIRFATDEVAEAQAKAKAAALALSQYRNAKGVIDPEKQSTIPLQQVAKLQDELIATRTQIMQLEKLAKDNPQLPVLRQRIGLLEGEIAAETNRVAGGERSLAGKAAEFQRLALEKEFSDKMLASAMSTLEQAKNEAQRKQLYLERIVLPNKPDQAMEPRRIRGILSTLAVGLVLFAVLTMLFAGMREHLD